MLCEWCFTTNPLHTPPSRAPSSPMRPEGSQVFSTDERSEPLESSLINASPERATVQRHTTSRQPNGQPSLAEKALPSRHCPPRAAACISTRAFAKPHTRRPHPSKRIPPSHHFPTHPPSSPRSSAPLRPSAIALLRSTRAHRRATFVFKSHPRVFFTQFACSRAPFADSLGARDDDRNTLARTRCNHPPSSA